MIKTEILADGRTHTWSDKHLQIRQETGAIFEEAVDNVSHTYTETDTPIPDYGEEATVEDYEVALNKLGVDV